MGRGSDQKRSKMDSVVDKGKNMTEGHPKVEERNIYFEDITGDE